jgi:hypothetical protein
MAEENTSARLSYTEFGSRRNSYGTYTPRRVTAKSFGERVSSRYTGGASRTRRLRAGRVSH